MVTLGIITDILHLKQPILATSSLAFPVCPPCPVTLGLSKAMGPPEQGMKAAAPPTGLCSPAEAALSEVEDQGTVVGPRSGARVAAASTAAAA